MKRVILTIMLTAILATGCAKAETAQPKQEPEPASRFQRIEYMGTWEVVVDRETGVMYVVSMGGYNQGTFTLLVDADGKPLIWEVEHEQE